MQGPLQTLLGVLPAQAQAPSGEAGGPGAQLPMHKPSPPQVTDVPVTAQLALSVSAAVLVSSLRTRTARATISWPSACPTLCLTQQRTPVAPPKPHSLQELSSSSLSRKCPRRLCSLVHQQLCLLQGWLGTLQQP